MLDSLVQDQRSRKPTAAVQVDILMRDAGESIIVALLCECFIVAHTRQLTYSLTRLCS